MRHATERFVGACARALFEVSMHVLQACHKCPGKSYVAAAYVKWIEAAGGRAVPIRCDAKSRFRCAHGVMSPIPVMSTR